MDYGLKKGQTTYPVSEAELADWIRVNDYQDPVFRMILMSATEAAQSYTRRAFLEQEFTILFDGYPGYGTSTGGLDVLRKVPFDEIKLPFAPLIEVDSVKIIRRYGGEETIGSDEYRINTLKEPGTIKFISGKPVLTNDDQLQVEYRSGFGDSPHDVPLTIRLAILQAAGYLYEHRGDCSPENALFNSGAASSLISYRVYEVL